MLRHVCWISLLGLAFFPAWSSVADETAPSPCGLSFVVAGDTHHHRATVPVTGAPQDDAANTFADEVYGQTFTAAVEGLPEGKYEVQIDLAEQALDRPGLRLMGTKCGAQVVAEHLDIFQAAGGKNRAYRITAQVYHYADQKEGGLSLVFTGEKENAKFNAIHILDAQHHGVACITAADMIPLDLKEALVVPAVKEPPIYEDPDQPQAARIEDLVRRMSLREKIGQTVSKSTKIDRLHVPAYSYQNECLHGLVGDGHATMFPQTLGNAATFDDALVGRMAESISTEGRAKHADAASRGDYGNNRGLSFWSPNVNIFRDPRWGRGQETYGEDPYLTSVMGVAYVRGLQGDDPRYLRATACAKHFAVHSGPEPGRGAFDVDPDERDLHDTYLPQFQALVQQGHVGAMMSSYNALYKVPASCSGWLLTGLLRDAWGFQGQVVSDCGAIANITKAHHYVKTVAEADALAVRAGCDLECGTDYAALATSVKEGLITEKEIDVAVRRNLKVRFDLGLFDPPDRVPYTKIKMDVVESPAHLEQATQLAREGTVLLKNDRNTLPLDPARLKRLAVIGENADSVRALLGDPWYQGPPSHPVTILQGIKAALGTSVEVTYAKGCPLGLKADQSYDENSPDFKQAVEAARTADAVIYVGGITGYMEGEEKGIDFVGFHSGDRTRIELPEQQTRLLQALHATGKPVVFVNCSGSAMAMPWEAENLPAIVQAWYPGTNGGTAVADVLFGKYNPAGRLPVTFYRSTQDLPDYHDYHMKNRTYRYFMGKPLYAFGHGLSYTTFRYGTAALEGSATLGVGGVVKLHIPVSNTGALDGDEVVQIYARRLDASPEAGDTIRSLVDFRRKMVHRGETVSFEFAVPVERLRRWDVSKKSYAVPPGRYEFQVAAASDDIRQTTQVVIQ